MADEGQANVKVANCGQKQAFGRSLPDFMPLEPSSNVWPAEKRLLQAAERGEPCEIGYNLPEKPTPENTVRGEFLRFLLLGGDQTAPVHEKGVMLRGAFIEGLIDLENAGTFAHSHCGDVMLATES